jgi:hypothetical protein
VLALIDGLGQPAALLTNNGPILEACLDRELFAMRCRFERCLLSCRLGHTKPDRPRFAAPPSTSRSQLISCCSSMISPRTSSAPNKPDGKRFCSPPIPRSKQS